MIPTQTLGVGTPVANKYGSLGFTAKRMVPPPTHLLGLCVGMSNDGKSSFFQSCPVAFIFNTDVSSTTNPDIVATIWPGINEDGRTIDPEKGVINLTWDACLEKKAELIRLAEAGASRPAMVVLDTLSTTIDLVKQHVGKYAHSKYRIAELDDQPFKALFGPAGWDSTYGEIIAFAQDLRRAGYGVYFVLHLTQKIMRIADDISKEVIDVNITDNFWSRLFPLFEIIFAIETGTTVVSKEVIRQLPGNRTKKETVDEKVPVHILTVRDLERLKHILKSRLKMDDSIVLKSEATSWADFETAYTKAAAVASTPSDAATSSKGS